MVNRIGTLGQLLAVIVLVLFATVGDATADSDSGGFNRRIAGSYLIQHDSTKSRDVLTIGADGIFLMNSSDSGVLMFGNSQGAWKRTGRRKIAARVVNFEFDGSGVGVVHFDISFDRRYRMVTGHFSGAVVDSSVADPLDADVQEQFSDSFTGRRITVD